MIKVSYFDLLIICSLIFMLMLIQDNTYIEKMESREPLSKPNLESETQTKKNTDDIETNTKNIKTIENQHITDNITKLIDKIDKIRKIMNNNITRLKKNEGNIQDHDKKLQQLENLLKD